jgi:hypothetical protein
LPDATPFSTFSLCTPQAAVLLDPEDEPVCSDGATPRPAIHAVLADMIDRALRWGFAGGR